MNAHLLPFFTLLLLLALHSAMTTARTIRTLERIIPAQTASDGAGVKLKRSIGSRLLDQHDPFLMLDEFKSDSGADHIAGFPSHPHRGFETVTYMLHGKMEHKDNHGNSGIIESGGVQWMTAGRGIVHSEMPLQEDGLMWGFQLWINLPAEKKMCAPRYQDIPAADVPEVKFSNGNLVRVVAGSVTSDDGTEVGGCVKDIVTSPTFLDITIPQGSEFEYQLPAEKNGFLYCFDGSVSVQDNQLKTHHLALLSNGDTVHIQAPNESGRVLLVAAIPLREPIAKHGPFVMNTQQQIMEAIMDYQSGKF